MADKLISFSEMVEKFDDCCGECGCCIHHLPDHSERNTHCLILNSLKAVDAVQVVRCRECIHRVRTNSTLGFSWCGKFGNIMRDADFCSWGERKMNGGAYNG